MTARPRRAQTELLGLSTLELQSCLGAPDQRTAVGDTQILSYYATSTGGGGVNIALPIIGRPQRLGGAATAMRPSGSTMTA